MHFIVRCVKCLELTLYVRSLQNQVFIVRSKRRKKTWHCQLYLRQKIGVRRHYRRDRSDFIETLFCVRYSIRPIRFINPLGSDWSPAGKDLQPADEEAPKLSQMVSGLTMVRFASPAPNCLFFLIRSC